MESWLSRRQLRRQNLQQLGTGPGAMAFDPSWEMPFWKNGAQKRGFTMNDFQFFHRVPIHLCVREIPLWALDDKAVRQVLLAKYPRLSRLGTNDRRNGRRAALIIYRAYRQCVSDEHIAAWYCGVHS